MEFNLELAVVTKQLQVKLKESGSTGDQPKKKALKDKALILQSLRSKLNNLIQEDGKSSVAILHLSFSFFLSLWLSLIICSLQFLLRAMKPIYITTDSTLVFEEFNSN